jgi:hypothetical protein
MLRRFLIHSSIHPSWAVTRGERHSVRMVAFLVVRRLPTDQSQQSPIYPIQQKARRLANTVLKSRLHNGSHFFVGIQLPFLVGSWGRWMVDAQCGILRQMDGRCIIDCCTPSISLVKTHGHVEGFVRNSSICSCWGTNWFSSCLTRLFPRFRPDRRPPHFVALALALALALGSFSITML